MCVYARPRRGAAPAGAPPRVPAAPRARPARLRPPHPLRRGRLAGSHVAFEQLAVALLLLAGAARAGARRARASIEPLERVCTRGDVRERLEALAACLELAGRLRAAQHQHAEQRACSPSSSGRRSASRWRYFAARDCRRRSPAAPVRAAQARCRLAHVVLVVVDHRVAVGRLVAGQAQRVERQRVGVGRGALLLDQAAEDAHLRRRVPADVSRRRSRCRLSGGHRPQGIATAPAAHARRYIRIDVSAQPFGTAAPRRRRTPRRELRPEDIPRAARLAATRRGAVQALPAAPDAAARADLPLVGARRPLAVPAARSARHGLPEARHEAAHAASCWG